MSYKDILLTFCVYPQLKICAIIEDNVIFNCSGTNESCPWFVHTRMNFWQEIAGVDFLHKYVWTKVCRSEVEINMIYYCIWTLVQNYTFTESYSCLLILKKKVLCNIWQADSIKRLLKRDHFYESLFSSLAVFFCLFNQESKFMFILICILLSRMLLVN